MGEKPENVAWSAGGGHGANVNDDQSRFVVETGWCRWFICAGVSARSAMSHDQAATIGKTGGLVQRGRSEVWALAGKPAFVPSSYLSMLRLSFIGIHYSISRNRRYRFSSRISLGKSRDH